MTTLILTRHGESLANKKGIYQGQVYNTTLTKLGEKQAKLLSTSLKKYNLKNIFTSPLERAYQTACIVSKKLSIPVTVEENLVEIHHGDWEGKTKKEVKRLYPKALSLWQKIPEEIIMPHGESLVSVQKRIRQFLNYFRKKTPEGTFLAISHDTALRVTIAEILGLPLNYIWRFHLDNAGLTIAQWGSQAKLLTLNSTEHLGGNKSNLDKQAL